MEYCFTALRDLPFTRPMSGPMTPIPRMQPTYAWMELYFANLTQYILLITDELPGQICTRHDNEVQTWAGGYPGIPHLLVWSPGRDA